MYLKTSSADAKLFADLDIAPPYLGAKDYHVVTADAFGDEDWLRDVEQATADALSGLNPKKTVRK